ncbi:MAG: hypothetical protein EKK68_13605 [Candidatus Competibacteraceae bacterium]|nr:MAG: hypothetical protein EKK68_13605 [Candidatus Competibacteraceae bacterium]
MNDAAEFETSLTGAIDFFQNLRRKLGTLDAETGVQHSQLQDLATSIAAIQQDQQQVEHTLAALAGNLQIQGDALREELHTALEQRVPAEQLAALEAQLLGHSHDLHDLIAAIHSLGQDSQTIRDQVQALEASLQALEGLAPTVEAGQAQWQQLQQEIAGLKVDLETQRLALTDAGQIQQSLQRQQDRLKHVESFMGKVAADSNSTRQILNVLQTDLTTQSDTLREFDQFWRDSFAAGLDRAPSPETPVAATLDQSPAPESAAIAQQSLDQSSAATAATDQEYADIQQELAAVQAALTDQGERLNGQDAGLVALRSALWEQLQNQQDQLGELASVLNDLRQTPVPAATEMDELAAELSALRETLTPRIETLDELQQSAQRQIQNQWDQISALETTLNELRQAPVPASTGLDAFAADLSALHETLTPRIEALDDAQQALRRQSQTQQDQLGELEMALNDLRQGPVSESEIQLFNAELATLHQALADQSAALNHLQRAADQRFADVSAALETQRLAEMQRELIQPVPVTAPSLPTDAIQQHLAELQDSVDALENRLVSQAQAFSGNFEQFRGLRNDIQAVQEQIAKLESTPQHWIAIEQNLADQEQEVAQLKDALQQVQADAQQLFEVTVQSSAPQAVDLEARLVSHSEQLEALSAVVETIRTDAKATQDKVVTMASNVAKRMHEFQNQVTAIETTQGERLQELEQKIIWLQAALETVESQRKPRRWFSMPASLTVLVLTVGATLMALATQAIRAAG